MKIFENGFFVKATGVLLLAGFVIAAATADVSADYRIVWSTIDGGGGVSSGGQYVLIGTIGQPDTGYSEGGGYEMLGGFWPGGPLCFVDFKHFARFAKLWLYEGIDLPADLDGNEYVDLYDLKLFVDVWLCLCPYDWPLR
jgi:hypothetical protein